MAVSRNELKAIVKELLVEVLSEGLGNVQATSYRPPAPGRVPVSPVGGSKVPSSSRGRRSLPFDPALDVPLGGGRRVSEAAKAFPRGPGQQIMSEIFADTAANTLPSLASDAQLGRNDISEGSSPGSSFHAPPGMGSTEKINGLPEEIFGEEAAGRWADLAFMPTKKSA